MRKYKISLILLQLLASTIVMMAAAKTDEFEMKKTEEEHAEERDLESEISQERDVFPDLLSFATYFNQ